MDATDAIRHYDPPRAHVISNPSDSQQNNVPQTSTEPIIPTVSSCTNQMVGAVGDASRPMPRSSTTPISPDPLDIDASARRGWNAKSVSPRSEPSEPAYHHALEEGSRQHSQTSARTSITGIPHPQSAYVWWLSSCRPSFPSSCVSNIFSPSVRTGQSQRFASSRPPSTPTFTFDNH